MFEGKDDSMDEIDCVCVDCVGDQFLKAVTRSEGQFRICTFCKNEQASIPIGALAEIIREVVDEFFGVTPENPSDMEYAMHRDSDFAFTWEREGELLVDIVQEIAEVNDLIAGDVQGYLAETYSDLDFAMMSEEQPYDGEARYMSVRLGCESWNEKWNDFRSSLLHEARFFNQNARGFLTELFDGLEAVVVGGASPAVLEAGPDAEFKELYRARCLEKAEEVSGVLCRPDEKLGPPPENSAKVGRMNPRGIPVFYGAMEPNTAISEVRPPVGSYVVQACFKVIRPVLLLDLNALKKIWEPSSYFDPDFKNKAERITFLRGLSERLARPVMPGDEYLEYMATQAVCEFLEGHNDFHLDGVIYPSVQGSNGGKNVVLFRKSSRVESIETPPKKSVECKFFNYGEEPADGDFVISEVTQKTTAVAQQERGQAGIHLCLPEIMATDSVDDRPATLRVDVDSLKVHQISAIEVVSTKFDVRREKNGVDIPVDFF